MLLRHRYSAQHTGNNRLSNSCVGVCKLQTGSAETCPLTESHMMRPEEKKESTSDSTPEVLRHHNSRSLTESGSPRGSANIPPVTVGSAAQREAVFMQHNVLFVREAAAN